MGKFITSTILVVLAMSVMVAAPIVGTILGVGVGIFFLAGLITNLTEEEEEK